LKRYCAATVWVWFQRNSDRLQWGLERSGLLSAMLVPTAVWLEAAILIIAGLWQVTPIKHACLRHCRSPIGFLTGHWRAGAPARSVWD
jgi:predicted metal-binding membrane protein